MESEQNKMMTVVVPAKVHGMLTDLADQDRRTIGGECSWLVEQEWARRGTDDVKAEHKAEE